jgi:hypothetical protein
LPIRIRSRKQIYERYYISGSILGVQENVNEKIVLGSSTVAAIDNAGDDVSTTLLEQATKRLDNDPKGLYIGNMLSIRVRGGDPDLSPYQVTFKMETNYGNRFEADMRVGVGEI